MILIILNPNIFTVKLRYSQSWCGIDPAFVNIYRNNLTKAWKILNNQGFHHVVIYNKDQDHPLIISGWKAVEADYNLLIDVVVEVTYYCDNTFGINSFITLFHLEQVPRYHNRYL